MARTIAKDHDQKRLMILKGASKVFANDGFDGASMARLAAECGISKANIYHYYPGKDAILGDILETHLSSLRDTVCSSDDVDDPPETRLRSLIKRILDAYQGADHEHQVQLAGMASLPTDDRERLQGYQREMVRHMASLLSAIAPEALGNDRQKCRSATMSVFGMLNWYYMWNSGAGDKARQDYAQLVGDLVLKGIRGLG